MAGAEALSQHLTSPPARYLLFLVASPAPKVCSLCLPQSGDPTASVSQVLGSQVSAISTQEQLSLGVRDCSWLALAEGCKPDIIPSLLSPEFPFSEDYSQEFPSLLFSLPACSPPALSFFSYLSQTCCQVDPRTHIPSPNKLSYPLVPSFPGNRAYSSPLQFCPVQDTLGIDSTVPIYGGLYCTSMEVGLSDRMWLLQACMPLA